jgi:hypothetical protein
MAYLGIISTSSASAVTLDVDTFTGDASTTSFSRSSSNAVEDGTLVFIDGIYQEKSEYSISGTSIVFPVAPVNAVTIEVLSNKSGIFDIDTFNGDNSTVTFARASSTANENQTLVYIDGVYQEKSEYSVGGLNVTFGSAPTSGTVIEIMSY